MIALTDIGEIGMIGFTVIGNDRKPPQLITVTKCDERSAADPRAKIVRGRKPAVLCHTPERGTRWR